ncbi:dihydroxy-acid dehydratase [Paenibacillus eucommiae]|uniref:Dihydroxy-acid dehydratase n=1 Tax=Paenibacillus eucommiae TaxID=1355755 RepID=A0ABS4IUL1_9BACL|nr:dihydroxy-acid dehydratase [Paenibacillus eucommiae]MBP1990775.1 dihydroxy-acid dehydratase [Paenibacillus eucommiae]
MALRSDQWFAHKSDETRLQHRAAMRAGGHVPESFAGKPIIGIFNSWNDFNSCNFPHKELVEYVKRGVYMAGGYPMELHTITTPSDFMKPSDLPYRNLMAMDIEEQIRALPIDGVVLLGECDKTVPAQLMGAASCDLPTLQLAAGHRASTTFKGKKVNYGTDLWKYSEERTAGKISEEDWSELEKCMTCSRGGCPVMGTASTMKSVSEMLGVMLPGTSSIPAGHSWRQEAAEATGKRIVEMVNSNLTISKLLTQEAFDNAIRLLAALGGSTNAVIHLTAIAGRLGLQIELDRFAELSKDVPLLVNLQPSGVGSMDDFFEAGGIQAVIGQILPLLDGNCLTALGRTLTEVYGDGVPIYKTDVISELEQPIAEKSGIAVLKGNLAPNGAILKVSASKAELHKHCGPAIVFEDYEAMLDQLDDLDFPVEENSVLLLRYCGPKAIGMPEWGEIPIPKRLMQQGVRDMVRISDARMSGTSYGTVILHTSPEAAAGGPIGLVRNGDMIEVDVEKGMLTLHVEESILEERRKEPLRAGTHGARGYMRLTADHILQADQGCDFDFLRPDSKKEAVFIPPIVGRG